MICIQTFNRPHYLKRVIDSLKTCDGIGNYTLVAGCEPGFIECVNIVKSADKFMNVEININETKLGCNDNTKRNVKRGFDKSDFVIILEDDLIVSWDFLRYMEWGLQTYVDDPEIWNITSSREAHSPIPANQRDPGAVVRNAHFTSIGWATWKDRFDFFYQRWQDGDEPKTRGWDFQCTDARKAWGGKQIRPWISRTHHIGETGLHVNPKSGWTKSYSHDIFMEERYEGDYTEKR